MLNRKFVWCLAAVALFGFAAASVFGMFYCAHTYANDKPTVYAGANEDCSTNIDFQFSIPGMPPMGGHLGNGDKYCLVSYTLDPDHGECASDAATGNVECDKEGTYYQDVYSGGGCGWFDLCNNPTQTQHNLRDNYDTETCEAG